VSPPTAYADVDVLASSSGAYYDAPSNSDGYTPTPMLTGSSHKAAGGESRASLASSGHSTTTSGSASLLSQGHRAWNREHQELVKHPNWYQKYPQIAALTQQFQETAYVYGRLIISERALAPDARSIKPIHIGGVAGGDKYLHNGILFKFATDPVIAELNGRPVYLFGGQQPSDEKAIKAMSRELLGADRYWGAFQDELHYPMMCLIDHKGFRMLAMAVLPISHDTIVYGSADGGRTVHSADPAINAVMEKVGKALNLKGHYVGLNEQHLIYGAGDVEVHRGTDGRHYVVDFARCSAPEAPPHLGDRRTVFSRLLRPEFTRAYKKPLCADAFTRWDANRDDAVVHAQDVVEATQYLYDQLVPAVARRIEHDVAACNVSLDISDQIKAAGGHPKHRFKFDPDFPLLGVTDRPPPEGGLHAGGVDDDDDDLDASVSGVLSAARRAPRGAPRRRPARVPERDRRRAPAAQGGHQRAPPRPRARRHDRPARAHRDSVVVRGARAQDAAQRAHARGDAPALAAGRHAVQGRRVQVSGADDGWLRRRPELRHQGGALLLARRAEARAQRALRARAQRRRERARL
jgi:hypothetical protein